MFKAMKRIFDKIGIASSNNPVDPSVFNDAVAMKTSWSPLRDGVAVSFRMHKWVLVSPERAEFQVLPMYMIFCGSFVLGGFLIGLVFVFQSLWLPALSGLLTSVIGIVLFYLGSTPVVIDKRYGFFRKKHKEEIALSRVYALQIIHEYHSGTGDNAPFHSYPLNLVLENTDRANVINHGDQNKTREEAQQLAQFLQKPLWDAS